MGGQDRTQRSRSPTSLSQDGSLKSEMKGIQGVQGSRDQVKLNSRTLESLTPDRILRRRIVMLRVGENLNVMVKKIGTAMKDRDPKPIQELAIAEAKAGVDFIDINLGPARKGGGELMEWIVKIVQEVVDTPLYLDTINAEAIEAGLKVYKNKKGKAVINSIMARPESMDAKFPIAAKYNAGVVALLWGPSGLPRDADERGVLAAELMQKCSRIRDSR